MVFLFSKKKAEAKKRKELSKKYFSAAVAYFEKKDFISSKKYFEKAIELDPENENAIYNLKIVMKKIIIEKKKRMKKSQILNGSLNKDSINSMSKNRFSLDSNKSSEKRRPKKISSRDELLQFLDLDRSASEEEMKLQINKQFKKWRTKVNTSDLKKRYEAEKMLSLISKARRVLIK